MKMPEHNRVWLELHRNKCACTVNPDLFVSCFQNYNIFLRNKVLFLKLGVFLNVQKEISVWNVSREQTDIYTAVRKRYLSTIFLCWFQFSSTYFVDRLIKILLTFYTSENISWCPSDTWKLKWSLFLFLRIIFNTISEGQTTHRWAASTGCCRGSSLQHWAIFLISISRGDVCWTRLAQS